MFRFWILTSLFLTLFADVPDAPQNVIVGNVTKFGCIVSWEPPMSDGGSPITSFIVELRDRTSVKWSPVQVTKADELSAVINDVIENKEYIFRVKGENKAGVGKPSAASSPVKIMDPIGESHHLKKQIFFICSLKFEDLSAGPVQNLPVLLRTCPGKTRTRTLYSLAGRHPSGTVVA